MIRYIVFLYYVFHCLFANSFAALKGKFIFCVPSSSGNQTIIYSIEKCFIKCSCVVLQSEDVNRTLESGRAPLHYAADFGQTDVMEYLISKGADLNVRATAHFVFTLICLLSEVTVATKITVPSSSSLHRMRCLIRLMYCLVKVK